MEADDTFLLRFRDGVMSTIGNLRTLAGTSAGNWGVKKDLFGWPLPQRLAVLAHPEHVSAVALWDADDPEEAKLPEIITTSPDAVVYTKVSESQLQEDVPMVTRGAEYVLETP